MLVLKKSERKMFSLPRFISNFCQFNKLVPAGLGLNLKPMIKGSFSKQRASLYGNIVANSNRSCHKRDKNFICRTSDSFKKKILNSASCIPDYNHKHLSTQSSFIQEITKFAPGLRPYLNLIRLDKPIGTWLLFIPCTWSISLAAEPGHLPDLKMLALFGTGAVLLRAAGCIINDMWDSDFDRKVTRTKSRPLAAQELTPYQALGFLAGVLTFGLMILLSLNWYSVVLGASSMLLVPIYPLMKRITHWPQLFLGITFNWGALLGWSAVKGYCDWAIVVPLYLACISWTLVYDTIYAHQDKDDDISIGVKSTALLFQDKTVPWLGAFSATMISCLVASGYMADQTWPYFFAVAGVSGHLAWQVLTVNVDSMDDCAAKFRSNKWLGLLLLSGIIAGNLIKDDEMKREENL